MASSTGNAYVFYATDVRYAVAVAVFVRLLRRSGLDPASDLVLIHPGLPGWVLDLLGEMGLQSERVAPVPLPGESYFRNSLVKLHALRLEPYRRVVYADADAIPLRSLDWLFDFEFDAPIAAPPAYWLQHPRWTTSLLVAHPAPSLWKRAERWFPAAGRPGLPDMDVINREFGNEIATLPATTACLNSEWERPGLFSDPVAAFEQFSYVHFTALGKPWSYTPERVRRERPRAHPLFFEMWERWWAEYLAVLDRCRRSFVVASRLHRGIQTGRDVAKRLLWRHEPANSRSLRGW